MSGFDALGLRNRRSVPWASVPRETEDGFRETVLAAVGNGWRLVSFFGMPEGSTDSRLVAVLAHDAGGSLGATSTVVGDAFESLTPECPSAHLFEREIAEQCGVVPHGHPWLKPLRRHPPDHLAPGRKPLTVDRDAYPFFRVKGEEVHEVAVGPVHAGIIEPGHFRFQAHGEEVLFLEIMLGYQHRGVERLLETAGPDRAVLVAESIAGDTVIGHAAAHCGAIEALARSRKTPRAQAIRGIALELERLANHIGDLGAIAGDVGVPARRVLFRPDAGRVPQPPHDHLGKPVRAGAAPPGRSPVRHPAGHGVPGSRAAGAAPGGARTGRARSAREPLGARPPGGGRRCVPGEVPRARLRGDRGPGLRCAPGRATRSSVRHLPVRPHPGGDGLGRRRAGAGAGAVAGDPAVARVSA